MSLWGEWGLSPHEKTKKALEEKRPLPIGRMDFQDWSERIISCSGLPASPNSQKFALARMILDLKPTVAFESDAFFIACLRKAAANQMADALMVEIREAEKAHLAKQKEAEDTAKDTAVEKMENGGIQGA